eukprot:SAG11_NODE_31_length_23119_cov_102.800608_4_plen_71_part_00
MKSEAVKNLEITTVLVDLPGTKKKINTAVLGKYHTETIFKTGIYGSWMCVPLTRSSYKRTWYRIKIHMVG